MPNIKVLTYNIKNLSSKVPSDIIISKVLKTKSDIICFQEVPEVLFLKKEKGAKIKLFNYLEKSYFLFWSSESRATKIFEFLFSPIIRVRSGLLIAIKKDKFKIKNNSEHILSEKSIFFPFGLERRICQKISLEYNKKKIKIINTHLTHRLESTRLKETKNLLPFCKDKKVIIAGDFNTTDKTRTYKTITKTLSDSFKDLNSKAEDTFSSNNSLFPKNQKSRRIDYIFYKGISASKSSVVLKDKVKGNNLSDHYAVLTEFKI